MGCCYTKTNNKKYTMSSPSSKSISYIPEIKPFIFKNNKIIIEPTEINKEIYIRRVFKEEYNRQMMWKK